MATPKLRFKEFDGDWNQVKISDYSNTVTSGSRDWAQYYSDKGDKFIRMTNLVRDGIYLDLSDLRFVDLPKDSNEGKRTSLQSGDILISITAELGKLGWINSDLGTAYINQHTALVRMNENVDSKFVAYTLSTEKYNNKLNNLNDSGAKAGLNLGTIRNFELTIPQKKEQTKIASFLSAVDEKIAQLTKKHELLSQYKQGMMQKLFSQQIRFKADDGSEFDEWETNCLADTVTTMQSGLSRQLHDEDIGLVVLRSNNIIDNKVSFDDVKFWYLNDPQGADVNNYLLDDGDVLVNFINSMAQIGKSAIYRKTLDRKVICTTNILRIKADQTKLTSEYLNFIFQTNEYQNYIQSITKPAVNQASFTTKEFKMMIFKIPCLEEQAKITNFLSAIDQKIEMVTQQIEQAKQWKKGLLQQMFV